MTRKLLLALSALSAVSAASAQVSITSAGSTYTQNFDWTTGTGAAVTWVDNASAQTSSNWASGASSLGWYSGFTGTDTFQSTNGTTNTGGSLLSNFYFSSTDTNRSLGGRPTGAAGAVVLGLRLTNNTGGTLGSFTLGYSVEVTNQRDATVSNTSAFSYFIGNPSNWATDSFTAASGLNATTPLLAVSTNIDGNLAGNRTSVSGTVSGLTWADGTDIWLRWTVPNVTNGPSIGLDDVSLSFSAVPEPSTYAALAGLGVLAFVAGRRRARA